MKAKRLAVLILSLLILGCGDGRKAPENGQPAPGFTLETLENTRLEFPSDVKGKVLAIRFWADWCLFCESEMRQLEPVYQKYRDQDLVILAINVRQDRKTVEAFVSKLGISYQTLLDPEGDVAVEYGVSGLPTTFFVSREGILRSRVLGESTPEIFEQIVKELL